MDRGFIGKIVMTWFEARLQHASSTLRRRAQASAWCMIRSSHESKNVNKGHIESFRNPQTSPILQSLSLVAGAEEHQNNLRGLLDRSLQ